MSLAPGWRGTDVIMREHKEKHYPKKYNIELNNDFMANVQTWVKRVEFIIQPGLLICNLFYTSSEPGALHWGGGWKTKTFPASVSAADILTDDKNKYGFSNYIMWHNGRDGLDEEEN